MKTIATPIAGLVVLEPDIYEDERGFFLESFHRGKYRDFGIDREFVQDNLSFSKGNVLRGLHFQARRPQAKLVQAVFGEVFDVAVDIRKDSGTFGKWFGIVLSGENMRQMFIPEGFAHGFCVTSETALFSYKCSDIYVPGDEGGLLWSDPDVGIDWPFHDPLLSDKDRRLPLLSELARS
jgi:dTDP-4-dehydrorhamnose 3,5-epimerase